MTEPNFGADRVQLLETFVRIVEAGSLSAAAAQLDATQPTISRRLQALERAFGVRLIQRSTHAMALTEEGQRCYERAQELLNAWQRLDSDVRGASRQPAGTLRVVAPHAFGQDQFIEPLAEYLRQYPDIRVEWMLHDRLPDFIGENIDCSIRVGHVSDPSLVAIKLGEVPRFVACAPSLLKGRAVPQHPQELSELPWISLHTFYHDEIQLRHRPTRELLRLEITPRLSTDSLYVVSKALRMGIGVGTASSWVLAPSLATGDLVHLIPEWAADPLPVYLIYPLSRLQPMRLRRFIDIMKEHVPAELRATHAAASVVAI